MVRRTQRVIGSALAVPLVLGIVFGVGLLSFHGHSWSVQAQVADPSRADLILSWYAARNQGDEAAAVALFADNAFYIGASPLDKCSLQTPCYDRATELQDLQALDAGQHYCLTVMSLQVAGNIVTGRLEVRADSLRARGVEHTVAAFMAEVRDGKIVSFFSRTDLADPLSALNAAIAAGAAQPGTPIPTPNPVCG